MRTTLRHIQPRDILNRPLRACNECTANHLCFTMVYNGVLYLDCLPLAEPSTLQNYLLLISWIYYLTNVFKGTVSRELWLLVLVNGLFSAIAWFICRMFFVKSNLKIITSEIHIKFLLRVSTIDQRIIIEGRVNNS